MCQVVNIRVNMLFNVENIALFIGLIWLIVLSIVYFRIFSHYNSLTKGASKKALIRILEDLLKDIAVSQKDIEELKNRCDKIEEEGLFHIQKIGLLRFNPFKDTGGDQSFILALLDGRDCGVVISGLYSRLGTRWYAKRIENGNGVDHELSDEEKKALEEAKSL